MNKNILIISSFVLGGMFLAASVFAAATISFSPVDVDVIRGESFDLIMAINPQGVESYTTKVELEYPADLLEVKSFSFGSDWMALSAQGYDLIDNTNGVLIKTAGYPGGLTSAVTFGTVSFLAKKSGSGVVKLGSNSMVLDAENENVLSDSLVQTIVGISAPVPIPTTPTTPIIPTTPVPSVETPVSETPAPSEEVDEEVIETEDDSIAEPDEQIVVTSEEGAQGGLLAGIAGLGSSLGGWLIIIAIILLLAAILITIRKNKQKN